ncbi:hypothetical protein [Arthrobacter polaris]|uniref:hypothetical protein n=1 Tax=Arthrobacter polaris TaxID=2813727 RepID=UPI001F2A815D|nr:hypothetical protein [Arthrobacter polaris]UIK88037.1 hypothetical protein J0916_11295 [Arthrobacter polaris]
MAVKLPICVRATRVTRKRASIFFGKGYFQYDVKFEGGEVQNDVNLDAVLQGARFPADFHSVMQGARAVAGEGVPGQWVDYPYGRPVRG